MLVSFSTTFQDHAAQLQAVIDALRPLDVRAVVTLGGGLRQDEVKGAANVHVVESAPHGELLREASLVEVWKGFEGRRPQTLVRLTPDGRRRFVGYLEELERVVRDALPKAESAPARAKQLPPGWQTA